MNVGKLLFFSLVWEKDVESSSGSYLCTCDLLGGQWVEGMNRCENWQVQAIDVWLFQIEMAATFYQEMKFRIFVRHDEFSEAKLRIFVSYMVFVVVLSEPIGTKLHPSEKKKKKNDITLR